jgi:hypothetical protein
MRKMILPVFILLISAVLLTSCSAKQKEDPTKLRITPFNLFEGKNKRFEPFLGSMSGAVSLHYTGPKTKLVIKAEVWEQGTKTSEAGSMNFDMRTSSGSGFDGEFIASVKPDEWPDMETPNRSGYTANVSLASDNGGQLSSRFKATFYHRAMGWAAIAQAHSFEVPDTGDSLVWGFQVTDENKLDTVDFTPRITQKCQVGDGIPHWFRSGKSVFLT